MGFNRLPKLKLPDLKKMFLKMPQLKIGDTVANVPIVQGGMGVGISLSGLASAVANEGGIGVIAANAIGMLEPDYHANGLEANKRALRKQIRIARKKSSGIIGVNIMVALNDFRELLQVSIEEKVDVVFMGAGLPLRSIPVQQIRDAGVKVVPIVSSARAAGVIFKYWQKTYNDLPDAVVVEGPKAGGHLGFKLEQIEDPTYALERLVPEVVMTIEKFEQTSGKEIPVIAAGGIYDGDDIYKFFELGARGVQMGTRFVATQECDADIKFKDTYVNCKEEDIMIIKSPVGMPGRAIRNSFLNEVDAGLRKKFRCPWRCLDHCGAKKAQYCISQALDNARLGKIDEGYAFAGANVYRVDSILSVKELLHHLKEQYFQHVEISTVDLRLQFEEALCELIKAKDEYTKTVKKSYNSVKSELEEMLGKGTTACREEYQHAVAKIESLKEEYADQIETVNELKQQLSKFFDTSILKIPSAVIA
jgi:nitronate monooxygenase